jgi:hypothetical protein
MVQRCGLKVMQVLEVGSILVSEIEWHKRVTIVNCIALLAVQVLQNVVLNNWVLVDCCNVGSGKVFSSNAVSEGEDVLVLLVLKSVLVNINEALMVTKTRISDQLLGLAGWVDASCEEWLLNDFTIVNVFENCNLLVVLVVLDLNHFPAEHHIDVSLVTLIKSNFVCVGEFIDLLVRGPELES